MQSNLVVRQIAALPARERKAMRRRLLALFRRAELRVIDGGIDDSFHRSLHSSKPAVVPVAQPNGNRS